MDPLVAAEPGLHWPSFGIYRLAKANPQPAERLASGMPIRATAHGDDVFLDLILPANDGPPTFGEIVRMPVGGGELERIGDSDVMSPSGNTLQFGSTAIAASDCNAYVPLHCEDEQAYRLVAMPYGED